MLLDALGDSYIGEYVNIWTWLVTTKNFRLRKLKYKKIIEDAEGVEHSMSREWPILIINIHRSVVIAIYLFTTSQI